MSNQGMEITRDGEIGGIEIGQELSIRDVLEKYKMTECGSAKTPLDEGFRIGCTIDSCTKVDVKKYHSATGSLIYLAICTRPNIKNQDPHKQHEASINHILRYLSMTDYKFLYRIRAKDLWMPIGAENVKYREGANRILYDVRLDG